MTIRVRLFVALAVPMLAVACGGDSSATGNGAAPPAGAKPTSPLGLKQAQELFQSLCSTCHGTSGKGDGPGSLALDPKPRSFIDATWQASVTDDHIRKVIVYGGASVGKSPVMPAQPQLKGQGDVLDGLVSIVRGFKSK